MTVAAGAFDGWGSSVVGGLVAAAAVVVGVWFAQWLTDRRRAAEAARSAADGLIIEISNLRDEACSRRRGLAGNYALYPLRNRLFVSHGSLHGRASYDEANRFYEAVRSWRELMRAHPIAADAVNIAAADFDRCATIKGSCAGTHEM